MKQKNPSRRGSGTGIPVLRHLIAKAAALAFLGFGTTCLQAQTLVHRWSFDSLKDSAGTANATLTGTAALSGGMLVIPGGGARTNYAAVPIGATIAAASSLTIETWFTSTANQNWAKVWMFGTPGADGNSSKYIDFTPYTGLDPHIPSASFNPSNAEVNTRGAPNATPLDAGVQILSTVVYDDPGNEIRLYLNGTLADSAVWNGTISQLGNTTQNFIGAPVSYNDSCFNGSIEEFRIWNGAMSAAQVTANATAGPGTVPPRDPYLQVPAIVTATAGVTASTVNVPVTNSATTNNLSVTAATLGGNDPAFFTVTSTLPLVVAPGATVNLALSFDPQGSPGNYSTTVTLDTNDPFKPQEIVTVNVEVALPDISVPATAAFGPVANTAPVQSFNLQIANVGLGELGIFDAEFIAGPAAPTHFQQFAGSRDFINDGPLLIAAQSTGNFPFTFDPTGLKGGIKSGILRIFTDDPDEGQIDIRVDVEVTAPAGSEASPVLAHRWSFTDSSDSAGSADLELRGTAAISEGTLVLPGGGVRTNLAAVPIGRTLASASSLTVETWFTIGNPAQNWSKIWMFGTPGSSDVQSTYIDFTPFSGVDGNPPSSSIRTTPVETNTRAAPNPAIIAPGARHHAVTVYDSAADLLSLYLDGTLVDSTPWTGEVFEIGNTTENFIGAAVRYNDGDWNGTVDELRIWTGAFTAANASVSSSTGVDQLPDLNAVPSNVRIGGVQVSGGNIVLSGVTGLVEGQQYHLETGTDLNDFAPIPGSTFSGGGAIPQVPAAGTRRFVRIVDGPTP